MGRNPSGLDRYYRRLYPGDARGIGLAASRRNQHSVGHWLGDQRNGGVVLSRLQRSNLRQSRHGLPKTVVRAVRKRAEPFRGRSGSARGPLEAGVKVGRGARIRRSLALSGASIGVDCKVTDSVIGLAVDLPPGTLVENRLVTEARADTPPHDGASVVGGLVYDRLGT